MSRRILSIAFAEEIDDPVTADGVWLRVEPWEFLYVPMHDFKRRDRASLQPGAFVVVTDGWCKLYRRARFCKRKWRSVMRDAAKLTAQFDALVPKESP